MFEEFRTRKLSMTSERSMFWEEKVAEPAFPYRDPRLLPFGNRRSRKNGALLVCTWIPERRVADWPGRARFSCVGDTGQCARRTPFASRYFLKTLRELSLGSVCMHNYDQLRQLLIQSGIVTTMFHQQWFHNFG